MKNYIYIYKSLFYLLLATTCLLTSCSSDDDPFSGNDNFVTAFSLKQGNAEYNAVISNNTITINVPDGISLKGATVSISLSENASIYPNPISITEWDDEIIFGISSYNSQQVKYKYTIKRTPISEDGSILLETQAEVDAFAAKNITSIEGNLIIGRTSGADSIKNLSALSALKHIGYSLIVNPTFAGESLTGFDALENVGGTIQMDGLPAVKSVVFPNLKTVGGIYLKTKTLDQFTFNQLQNVAQSLAINSSVSELNFPNLKYIGESLIVNDNARQAMLKAVSFPSLEKVNRVEVTNLPSVTKIQMGKLKTVGDIYMIYLPVLAFLDVPQLETATGTITYPTASKLIEASFPELKEANSLIIDGKDLSVLEFSKLTTVKKLYLQNIAVSELATGFPKLTIVEEELKIQDLPKMKKLAIPSTINKIEKLTIYMYSTTPYEEINVKGLNIGELSVQREAVNGVKIIGDDIFKGTLSILGDNAKSYALEFPTLQGFVEVDSLNLGSYISNMTNMEIKGIKKIKRSFYIPNNNITKFSLPDLEEVGGNFTINHLNGIVVDTKLIIPNLRTIGGQLKVAVNSSSIATLEFSKLESVGKEFLLSTGYASTSNWSKDNDLTTISFPMLRTVGGVLSLAPDQNYSGNTNEKLKNLNGFSALTKVGSVSITEQGGLVSYQGLSKVVNFLTETTWNVKDNAYNPTFKDIQAGKFVK